MANKMTVVVIGGLHHNTLGVIRSLGEAKESNIEIVVLIVGEHINRSNFISVSKYVNRDKVCYVDTNACIVEWLIENASYNEKQVVICCSDGSAEAVISNHELIKQYYYTPTTEIDITELMSKQVQTNIGIECGFNVPAGKIIKSTDYLEWNRFPCISKPIKSAYGAGKGDIQISNSQNELKEAMVSTVSEYVQIQELIDKKMEYQLIGCSLDAGRIIIIPGYTDIIRQPKNTNTGYLKYSPIREFTYNNESVEKYIRKIGYSGLFSLEFIRDKNNNDYFLEINMRNDGNACCVKSAGVNLPYIWTYYQAFHRLPDCDISFINPVYFMPDWNDIRRGIKSVGIVGWIKEFVQAESHAVYNKKDMWPFITQSLEMVGVSFRYVKRKLLK